MEWIFIIIIVVVLIFGVKKIPELARTFGRAGAEYEKSRLEAKREVDRLKNIEGVGRSKLEEVADSLGIEHRGKSDEEVRSGIDQELKKISGRSSSNPSDGDMMR